MQKNFDPQADACIIYSRFTLSIAQVGQPTLGDGFRITHNSASMFSSSAVFVDTLQTPIPSSTRGASIDHSNLPVAVPCWRSTP